MTRRGRRITIIAAAGALLALAAGLTLMGLKDSVVFFYAPSELAQKARAGEHVRIGGLVEPRSVVREAGGALLFTVTDNRATLRVRYEGQPPDLFKEGQGVVAEGVWRPGDVFHADRVLAKHDEKYVPREVVEALKERGEWRPQ
ncbi:MAG: cytochrome c maturation protein CcmE [Hyphomonadaceae bacterium]